MVLQRITIDFLWHLVYFPIWWYTGGVKKTLIFCFNLFQTGNENLAPGLWLRNIFVPMFGQTDWQGRIMSFFMRLVNVIFRFIILAIWFFVVLIIFFLWLILPIFIGYMLALSF